MGIYTQSSPCKKRKFKFTSPVRMSPTGRGGRIRSDPRNPSDPRNSSDPLRSEPDPTWFFKKVKLIRLDLNPTRPDATRDQIAFNPIEIYQWSEKIQHINWPDPIRFLLKDQTDPTRPTRTRTRIRTRPVRLPTHGCHDRWVIQLKILIFFNDRSFVQLMESGIGISTHMQATALHILLGKKNNSIQSFFFPKREKHTWELNNLLYKNPCPAKFSTNGWVQSVPVIRCICTRVRI
jgi:hypothetical protein